VRIKAESLIVYFSKYGNTQLVAEKIGKTIRAADGRDSSVRLISADKLVSDDLESADLVVMGTPTHKMNLPEAVRLVFERLPCKVLRGKQVAAFDTSYKMSALLARLTAAKKLNKSLRKLGGKQVVPPETFHVIDREGPLYKGELGRAEMWTGRIVENVKKF
jgi:flavodoxin